MSYITGKNIIFFETEKPSHNLSWPNVYQIVAHIQNQTLESLEPPFLIKGKSKHYCLVVILKHFINNGKKFFFNILKMLI